MTEPTLHPNLAKIAAAYDEIIERLANHVLTPPQARAQIAQLEARDDEGVRWAIDPDTGAWTRKTAFGDVQFDASPPTFGYATADAHALSPDGPGFNPQDRLTYQAVADIPPFPGSLLGATRRAPTGPTAPSTLTGRLRATTLRTRVVAGVVAAIAAAALVMFALPGGSDEDLQGAGDVPAAAVTAA